MNIKSRPWMYPATLDHTEMERRPQRCGSQQEIREQLDALMQQHPLDCPCCHRADVIGDAVLKLIERVVRWLWRK